ncbi:hypothetical protein M422DRAFT_240320 [Sphaerobolus stellatus SS14]|nr:hypothetical protein M422DRAFT_240320 [Sphaerobolus stellatus SS14]
MPFYFIAKAPKLRNLVLISDIWYFGRHALNLIKTLPDALPKFIKAFTNLEEFTLKDNTCSERNFDVIMPSNPLSQLSHTLRSLNLSNLTVVTWNTADIIAGLRTPMPLLENLYLGNIPLRLELWLNT